MPARQLRDHEAREVERRDWRELDESARRWLVAREGKAELVHLEGRHREHHEGRAAQAEHEECTHEAAGAQRRALWRRRLHEQVEAEAMGSGPHRRADWHAAPALGHGGVGVVPRPPEKLRQSTRVRAQLNPHIGTTGGMTVATVEGAAHLSAGDVVYSVEGAAAQRRGRAASDQRRVESPRGNDWDVDERHVWRAEALE